MNPSYKLQLDLYIRAPVESNSVWMRRMQYLPFVPRAGDTIRLSQTDDEEQQVDLTLDEVAWDMAAGMFVAVVTDESQVEAFSESGAYFLQATVDEYVKLGFMRLNFPQAQVIR